MKLEIDRRRVRDRIVHLEKELKSIRKARQERRRTRKKRGVPVISIIGYTNAGKSTLLNGLTKSAVAAENRLFATLDPKSSRLRFPREREAVITDTVGFIRDLPEDLFAAFRATLEELEEADVFLHVVDVSNPRFERQMEAVDRIVEDLNLQRKAEIRVFNKTDLFPDNIVLENLCHRFQAIPVSALHPASFGPLLERLEKVIQEKTGSFFLDGTPGENEDPFPEEQGTGSA